MKFYLNGHRYNVLFVIDRLQLKLAISSNYKYEKKINIQNINVNEQTVGYISRKYDVS